MTGRRLVLLNPGPVNVSARVRDVAVSRDLCHREPEFRQILTDVRRRLVDVYRPDSSPFAATLVTGSGTAAVEMMVGSLVPRDGLCLVASNGAYGERVAEMLAIQGKPVLHHRRHRRAPLDLDALAELIRSRPAVTHVVAVHMETTTGRLNDVGRLADLCERTGVPLLLDCVSSFGAEDIPFRSPALQACAATANKCLQGIPGVSFVLVRGDALRSRPSASTSLYLDLHRNLAAQSAGDMLFTQAVPATLALAEALRELADAGGWRARGAAYRRRLDFLVDRLRPLGLRPFPASPGDRSSSLCTFELPAALTAARLRDTLRDAGFVTYPGPAREPDRVRIAVMGELTEEELAACVAGVEEAVAMCR